MHTFDTTVSANSKVLDGVRITVRRLSKIQLAKRDLKIIEPQVRIAELGERMRLLREPYLLKLDDDGKEILGSAPEMPLEMRVELTRLDREQGALINAYVKPATIRAGLVKIEGAQYDNKQGNADAILDNGPDELIDEVWALVAEHCELSVEEQKNSQSPSTSVAAEGGEKSNTTAATVSSSDTTKTETAASTSLTT